MLANSGVRAPPGHYGFLEAFCDEPDCDCRRVFLNVVSPTTHRLDAVIAWGWETRNFYRKWLGQNNRQVLDELMGPALNLSSPQSPLAPALVELVSSVLLRDAEYVARVKRHYRMFRDQIERAAKPTGLSRAMRRARKL